MFLIFDTETTGLPKRWNAPLSDTENWPRCIQIAWQLHDNKGVLIEHEDYLIQPEGFNVPYDAEKIHGISTELASKDGVPLEDVIERFQKALSKTKFIVGQNLGFDNNIMGAEFIRLGIENPLPNYQVLDTCKQQPNCVSYPGAEEENLNFLLFQSCTPFFLIIHSVKRTTLLPM